MPLAFQDFRFATNANGEITFWAVGAEPDVPVGSRGIATYNDGIPGHRPEDSGFIAVMGEDIAYNFDSPGVRSQGIATPDAGSTLSLMTLTLMALGLVARRFKRTAA